jgi:hypothetical protein
MVSREMVGQFPETKGATMVHVVISIQSSEYDLWLWSGGCAPGQRDYRAGRNDADGCK